jgi:large subunit ribosomal protein L29
MKMKEILEKQGDQLDHELLEQQKHLFDLRSQAVTEKLEDPSQIAKTRKDIARIKTVLRQRQLEQQRRGEAGKTQPGQKPGKPARRFGADSPAFGRRTRVNAAKQKVRARKTGGGKTAARKVKARKEMYKTRRRGKSVKAR